MRRRKGQYGFTNTHTESVSLAYHIFSRANRATRRVTRNRCSRRALDFDMVFNKRNRNHH
jgi:hypothetical protein